MSRETHTYRKEVESSIRGNRIRFLVVPTLVWNKPKRSHPDSFIISLSVRSDGLESLSYPFAADSSDWTEIAHSDHNPAAGHDIYDRSDPKQLHVDVNDLLGDERYAQVYTKLSGGNPDRPVGRPVDKIERYLTRNRHRFLADSLRVKSQQHL